MLADLVTEAQYDPERPIQRILYGSPDFRVLVLALAQGQEMPDHTSTSSVLLHVVSGRGRIRIGADLHPAGPGTVAICPPARPHGIIAEEAMTVLAVIAPQP